MSNLSHKLPIRNKTVQLHNVEVSGSSVPRGASLTKNLMEVQESERRRISRELHDALGQRLALLEITVSRLEQRNLPVQVTREIKNIQSLIGEMDRDIHRICYALYPVVLETLGLIVGLKSLCRDFSELSGISTVFDHEHVPQRLPESISLCLYRVTQEALHNISKHANAMKAKVSLRGTEVGLEIRIMDSGCGFDPFLMGSRSGLGLITIKERVRSAGGHSSILSAPGAGTEIRAVVKLCRQEAFSSQ